MNYQKMIEDIDKLVETDFSADMDGKTLPKSEPYTQKEARKMASIIGRVYLIAHGIHCTACGKKYKLGNE